MDWIVFKGSPYHLSDILLTCVTNTFDDLNVARNPDPDEIDGKIRVVVLAPDEIGNAREAVEFWRSQHPDVSVMLCLDHRPDLRKAFRDLREGGWPSGVSLLPLNVRLDVWLTVLRLALVGDSYVPIAVVVDAYAKPAVSQRCLDKLTCREAEVLRLAAQGAQNKSIARSLDVSEHTVKLHMHHIIKKLGVRNRTEAAQQFLVGGP